jgi:hypothetical protein
LRDRIERSPTAMGVSDGTISAVAALVGIEVTSPSSITPLDVLTNCLARERKFKDDEDALGRPKENTWCSWRLEFRQRQ